MITLNPIPPSPANLTPLDQLITLIQFFTDPKACADRLLKITQEVDKAAEVIVNADMVKAEIAAERAALTAEREAQEKKFEDDRTSLEQRRLAWVAELNARDTESRKMSDAAKVDREAAARLKADLERRVKQVQQAVA
jgi:hypothetical protein